MNWTISLIYKIRLLLSSFDEYFEAIPSTGVGTLAKIRMLLGQDASKINLCDIIWRRYGIGGNLSCPKCRESLCNCYDENQKLLVGETIEPWVREKIRTIDSKLQ